MPTKSTVAIAVIAIFTMLLPISIAESSLSYSSDSFITSLAFLLPSPAIFFTLILFSDVNAVSVAEKYADIITRTTIAITDHIL